MHHLRCFCNLDGLFLGGINVYASFYVGVLKCCLNRPSQTVLKELKTFVQLDNSPECCKCLCSSEIANILTLLM